MFLNILFENFARGGVKLVFGVTGTTVNMLFVTLEREEGIDYVCPLHEQGGSFGADGYARVSGELGVAIATSGPGATNMLTGCAGAYTDGIPVLYIFGQAAKSKGTVSTRFFGFQEIDLESIYKPVTKYAKEVRAAEDVRYEMEKAINLANSGRKGPVALIFPEDVLYEQVDGELLRGYDNDEVKCDIKEDEQENKEKVRKCMTKLQNSTRPLLLYGAGIHRACAEMLARIFAERANIPVVMTFPARDLLDSGHPLNAGPIGVFGSKSGNNALSESDFVLAIGVRFDRQVTGIPSLFCRSARMVVVDYDKNELKKLNGIGIEADGIEMDAGRFFEIMNDMLAESGIDPEKRTDWVSYIKNLKIVNPICKAEYEKEPDLNPYYFMEKLSGCLDRSDIIFSDTGLSTVWIGQAFRFQEGQRWHTQFSYSSMGYALPAAIGGSFATDGRIICICGDGGLQMSIEELAVLKGYNRDVKVFCVANDGYGMIQKTQDDFNNGHAATDRTHHVLLPDSLKIARAYGLDTYEIKTNRECTFIIRQMLESKEPAFCLLHIPMKKKISPRVKAGRPLYEMTP